MSPNVLTFNLDVEALYDSLRRDQVELAIRAAIKQCRPTWSDDFAEWLVTSVNLSLDSAVGLFKGKWYQSTGGVATGGKLCVYVANITVFWAFHRVIYSTWPKHLLYLFRFVDDGTGGWSGSPGEFFKWFCKIYKALDNDYNLRLTCNLNFCLHFMEFLEVRYRFVNKMLDTDVNYKDTDAHRYLNYNSTHLPHMFKSVVYSQFLRLRRIIIDFNLLLFRINEMTEFFRNSDYPLWLLTTVKLNVLGKTRNLDYKVKKLDINGKFGVGWVTTYAPGHGDVKDFIAKANEKLRASPLFMDMEIPILGIVTRRAPNLRDLLFSQRSVCLNTGRGLVTARCTSLGTHKVGRPCEACDLMSNQSVLVIGKISYICSGGDCSSFNINYCAQCVVCLLAYIGKTIGPLRTRICEHRNFMTTLGNDTNLEITDDNTLAAHAAEHGIQTKAGFNSLYRFYVIRHVEKEQLTMSEQFFINKFNTIKPYGLNVSNPIGLPDCFQY